MSFFNGLYSYEIVLMVLGVLLFITLLFCLPGLLSKGKSYAGMLPFFVVSVAMIGYPSLQSFKYKDGEIDVEKKTQELLKDPTNKELRQSLETQVSNLSARPDASSESKVTLARAQFALGNQKEAESNLDKALATNPTLPAAQDLKRKIELTKSLSELTSKVTAKPDDSAAKSELEKTVTQVNNIGVANPQTLTEMGKAYKVLGKHDEALATVDKALVINPGSPAATQVRANIKAVQIQPVQPSHQ